jgi:hypothetical protein
MPDEIFGVSAEWRLGPANILDFIRKSGEADPCHPRSSAANIFSSNALDNHSNPLAATDTCRRQTIASAAAMELVQQRQNEPRTRRT